MTDAEIARERRQLEGQGATAEGTDTGSLRLAALLAELGQRAALRTRPFPAQRAGYRSVLDR